MTLNDPLLKDLKAHIATLVLSDRGGPFGDHDERVFSLCICLERIFSKGLVRHDGFTPWRTDSFQWFYQLMRKYHRTIPLVFKVAFEEVLSNAKTKTAVGKTRLLLRTCLKRRCLFVPIQFHVENEDYANTSLRINYDPTNSVLGHEIFARIFLSLTQQLSCYDFNLDLYNSSFLDESWQLPTILRTEMVPCTKLGLTLGFPLGFALIVDILDNSCAAEIKHLIGVGDILDEVNEICIRGFYGSKIELLFRKIKSQPFKLTFIKGLSPNVGQIYLPIIKLYRIMGLDPEVMTQQCEQKLPEEQKSLCDAKDESSSRSKFQDEERLFLDDSYNYQDPASKSYPDEDLLGDLLGHDEPEQEPSLLSNENGSESKPYSKLQPYPQSQNNVSPTSALNLQRYPDDSDQLIV